MFKDMLVDKGALALRPGKRDNSQLDNGTRIKRVSGVVKGTLNITAPVASILNRGSVLGGLDVVGLNLDGKDRIAADARAMRVAQELFSRREFVATRAASLAIGAYALEESFTIFCAQPQLAVPDETALTERATGINVNFFANTRPVPAAGLVKGGAATLDNLSINVTEEYDLERGELPLLRPFVYEISQDVLQANKALELPLRPSAYLAALLIQQDTDDGEVSDIINTVQLIADGGKGIIPYPTPYQDLVSKTAISDDYQSAEGKSYLMLDFMSDAKLSRIINPVAWPNLRFRFDCQPSVGRTGSKIRVTLWTYEEDLQLTQKLPFPI